jgi:hypothetical protein
MSRWLFLIAATALSASPAHADWVRVGETGSGAVWYMDGARITTDGSKVHAWVKIDASRDATLKYRESLEFFGIICGSQKIRLLSFINYDSYGKVTESVNGSDSSYGEYGYNPVAPETMGEMVLKVACAITKGD